MEFGHSIGARPLETHHHHHVSVKLARAECGGHARLILENPARRLDCPARFIHCRGLETGAAQIALNQSHSSIRFERISHGAEHGIVGAWANLAPDQRIFIKTRLVRVIVEIPAPHCQYIAVRQSGF